MRSDTFPYNLDLDLLRSHCPRGMVWREMAGGPGLARAVCRENRCNYVVQQYQLGTAIIHVEEDLSCTSLTARISSIMMHHVHRSWYDFYYTSVSVTGARAMV